MLKKIFIGLFISSFIFIGYAGLVEAHGSSKTAEKEVVKNDTAGLIPGDFFYFLDIFSEQVSSFFTFGDIAKAKKYVSFANERLAEAQELASVGKAKEAANLTQKYQNRIKEAIVKAKDAKSKGENVDKVLSSIAKDAVKDQVILANVYDKMPKNTEDAVKVKQVMQNSVKGYEVALSSISKDMQVQMKPQVEQMLNNMDTELNGLRDSGKSFPEINMKGMEDIGSFTSSFDDSESTNKENENSGESANSKEIDGVEGIDSNNDSGIEDSKKENISNEDLKIEGSGGDMSELQGLDKKVEKDLNDMMGGYSN